MDNISTAYNRRNSRSIGIGGIFVGGDAPIAVQSMTNTPAHDITATTEQIKQLEAAGCDIVRAALPDRETLPLFGAAKGAGVKIPIVADIHFSYKLAIEAAYAGADKIRINPGNIGDADRVKQVAEACRINGIPIRVGVNSGSLEREMLEKYGSPTPEALAESALNQAKQLERFDFNNIVIAIKSSDVRTMVATNRLLSQMCDYPLHLGVTEAGGGESGLIKNSAGIGALLCGGIGDTIRLSLSDAPISEVRAGRKLLKALGLDERPGVDIISCPTCGRTRIDIIALSRELEQRCAEMKLSRKIKVAVMGCAVNGPGEAREADIGIAGGDGEALLFRRGEIIRKLPENGVIECLIKEIEEYDNGQELP